MERFQDLLASAPGAAPGAAAEAAAINEEVREAVSLRFFEYRQVVNALLQSNYQGVAESYLFRMSTFSSDLEVETEELAVLTESPMDVANLLMEVLRTVQEDDYMQREDDNVNEDTPRPRQLREPFPDFTIFMIIIDYLYLHRDVAQLETADQAALFQALYEVAQSHQSSHIQAFALRHLVRLACENHLNNAQFDAVVRLVLTRILGAGAPLDWRIPAPNPRGGPLTEAEVTHYAFEMLCLLLSRHQEQVTPLVTGASAEKKALLQTLCEEDLASPSHEFYFDWRRERNGYAPTLQLLSALVREG